MRLPDKVQQKQFTREEQLLLAGRYETESVISDAADDVFSQFGHQRNESVSTLHTLSISSQSSYSSRDVDFFSDSVSDSDSDMDESMMDSFRWMDEEEDLDLTLDDYHIHMASTTEPSTKPSSRRPSFRRSLSMTHPTIDSTLGSPKPSVEISPDPPKPTRRKLTHAIPHISTQYAKPASPAKVEFPPTPPTPTPTPTHASQTPRHIIETSARHYQDPEARLKLRVFLSSPQKLDEALEFGFPALEAQEIHIASPPPRPSLINHHPTAPTPHTWFEEDKNLTVVETLDSESDTISLPQTPRTPASRDVQYSSPRTAVSTDADPPQPRKPPAKLCTHVVSGTREMTLRMTLTRPDLRKDDDQADSIYGDGDEDLFTLEQMSGLVACGDIWDSLPLREGVVKKLWQKVSRKGGGD